MSLDALQMSTVEGFFTFNVIVSQRDESKLNHNSNYKIR